MRLACLLVLASCLVAGDASSVMPLPLGGAATTPFRDEIAGDGRGGWTDQGENDLRALAPGVVAAGDLRFAVGAAGIVLADGRIAGWPRTVTVDAGGRSGAALYLLHASAWTPRGEVAIGRLRLRYADGGSEEREVRSRREVADWWNPVDRLPAAVLAWCGENAQAQVGLYAARIAIPDRPLQGVELEAVGGAVWMVAAIALGADRPLPAVEPDGIVAGPRWLPAEVTWEVAAGSPLDLGGAGPAAAPVRLEARGGDLVRADDGRSVRLLGANLCFSANFPERADAERMATAFRRMGHNAVRFHHHDGGLVKPGGDGSELDPEKIARLDWLAASCRREGLWFTTDVYVSRKLPKGAIPELADMEAGGGEFKALLPLLPSAMENWKRFATAFLGHRNPHTGLTWAEDPALATLSLVNEDNLPKETGRNPRIAALYEQRFAAWLEGRPEAERSAPARDATRARWLLGLQAEAYRQMAAHVRSLGVRAPLTGVNWQADWWSLAMRENLELVDNHAYHDHPSFPGKPFQLPMAYQQRSAVAELLRTPAGLAHTRRLDRPFTVSEVQYCQPNHRRAEYAAGVAAVAGLQGWSGIWRFAFAHNIRLVAPGGGGIAGFDIARDPIALLGERAMALLWRRGDIAAAPWAAGLVVDPAVAGGRIATGPNAALSTLALHARIGFLPPGANASGLRALLQDPAGGTALPVAGLPVLSAGAGLLDAVVAAGLAPRDDLAARRVRSAGGQVRIDGDAGTLAIATPSSCAAVLPGGASAELGEVRVVNSDADPATVVLASLDGAPLAQARRLLLLHLTDAQTSGVRFASRRHAQVDAWGDGPVLVRAGALQLRLSGAGRLTAHALDLGGARREQVAATGAGFDLAVARPWGPCLAWEIVRE